MGPEWRPLLLAVIAKALNEMLYQHTCIYIGPIWTVYVGYPDDSHRTVP